MKRAIVIDRGNRRIWWVPVVDKAKRLHINFKKNKKHENEIGVHLVGWV